MPTMRTLKTLTLERFARLPSAWPENLSGICGWAGGAGILIARIHPNCNRPVGDENVVARALVYTPADQIESTTSLRFQIKEPSDQIESYELRRLTIRTTNLIRVDNDAANYHEMYANRSTGCLAITDS